FFGAVPGGVAGAGDLEGGVSDKEEGEDQRGGFLAHPDGVGEAAGDAVGVVDAVEIGQVVGDEGDGEDAGKAFGGAGGVGVNLRIGQRVGKESSTFRECLLAAAKNWRNCDSCRGGPLCPPRLLE